ncbi:unnamed protein product [Pieris brassicae]|uniref:Centromere protein J C-terminal domain-containing protein n=1 Tax=Pieris brassicae TaxID=7116 RepID=A0A9P0XAV1_PIEBR|nr:unnamed protein product [Pieris brassicae]
MDNSYSESDISLSPSQIFEKLDMLRQLQMMQRGKLLKQRLDYQNSPEISSSITEIVSHFSNSTTYNTFKSLLQSPRDRSTDATPEVIEVTCANSEPRGGQNLQNIIDGVSVLNLSHESENITEPPISSKVFNPSKLRDTGENLNEDKDDRISSPNKKQISLDEMPILSPKKNFEELIVDTLKHDQQQHLKENFTTITKKQYLKRGEGMARFGIKKNNLIIQNTKSLPWRLKAGSNKTQKIASSEITNKTNKQAEMLVHVSSSLQKPNQEVSIEKVHNQKELSNCKINNVKPSTSNLQINKISNLTAKVAIPKPPIHSNKGKNWAAVLTKEQDDFLRKLKQSEYYKTFPTLNKSVESDISSCESSKVIQNKEIAEQKLFELIEKKVSHDSFNINNSFFDKFIKSKFETSGESTPLIMQKCLTENPDLMHINSNIRKNKMNKVSASEDESCISECTDCSECCSVFTCCSCQTEAQSNDLKILAQNNKIMKGNTKLSQIEVHNGRNVSQDQCQNVNDKSDVDKVNANIAEMNAKLIATSDTLKVRLQELEDEIETFRKENANITKMREEIDLERQKFYEEKSSFEQKFNEEKILSEYYLAKEKEKLMKQKQIYERYVRDIRGRLNKKEKDEVANLKKEISVLKDDIRVKDAKSTSTIARLRNQLKLMEKDKKNLEDELEKLKKENKRIQHSNDVTRRLTNIKYLEQINRKLSTMAARETKSEIDLDPDIKYKALEIEKQSKLMTKGIRTRAKSVPNLNVTSKYAKYFSQKDSVSDKGKNTLVTTYVYTSDNDIENESIGKDSNGDGPQSLSENDDNYLEKIYNERFKSNSPSSKRSSETNSPPYQNTRGETSSFFLQKTNSVLSNNKKAKSPIPNITPNSSNSNISKSPPISERLHHTFNQQTVKESKSCLQNKSLSPLSVISNQSTNSQKPMTVIYNDSMYNDERLMPSPEPTSSTSITKTNLNPIETIKSNGTRELRFPNGNLKIMSADGKYSKFIYYNGDIKENFYNKGIIKYFYSESKTYHTTHSDGLEVLEFPDGQVEKRYRDGSSEIRLPNGMVRYFDPNNDAVQEEWRYPDGTALSVSANGEQHITFPNGQIEVHTKDHKRREFPDGSVKLVYSDGTSETRYASGRIRIKDKHGNLIMDSSLRKNHTMR